MGSVSPVSGLRCRGVRPVSVSATGSDALGEEKLLRNDAVVT